MQPDAGKPECMTTHTPGGMPCLTPFNPCSSTPHSLDSACYMHGATGETYRNTTIHTHSV